jgi:hypothetical protein
VECNNNDNGNDNNNSTSQDIRIFNLDDFMAKPIYRGLSKEQQRQLVHFLETMEFTFDGDCLVLKADAKVVNYFKDVGVLEKSGWIQEVEFRETTERELTKEKVRDDIAKMDLDMDKLGAMPDLAKYSHRIGTDFAKLMALHTAEFTALYVPIIAAINKTMMLKISLVKATINDNNKLARTNASINNKLADLFVQLEHALASCDKVQLDRIRKLPYVTCDQIAKVMQHSCCKEIQKLNVKMALTAAMENVRNFNRFGIIAGNNDITDSPFHDRPDCAQLEQYHPFIDISNPVVCEALIKLKGLCKYDEQVDVLFKLNCLSPDDEFDDVQFKLLKYYVNK